MLFDKPLLWIIIGMAILLGYALLTTNRENLTNVSEDLKDAINQVYNADVDAIRNLSDVATKLQAGGLTVPGSLTVRDEVSAGKLAVTNEVLAGTFTTAGNYVGKDLTLSGNASITGNISGKDLAVGGNASITGNISGKDLAVGGNASISGITTVMGKDGNRMVLSGANGDFFDIEAMNKDNTAKKNINLNAYGGNVGVGTVNPQAKLDVVGNTRVNGTFSSGGDANIGGSAVVNGNTTLKGKLNVGNGLYVTGKVDDKWNSVFIRKDGDWTVFDDENGVNQIRGPTTNITGALSAGPTTIGGNTIIRGGRLTINDDGNSWDKLVVSANGSKFSTPPVPDPKRALFFNAGGNLGVWNTNDPDSAKHFADWTINADGSTSFNNLNIRNTANINGATTVNGATRFNNSVNIIGSKNNNVPVENRGDGLTWFNHPDGNNYIRGNTFVSGGVNIDSDLTAGATTVNGALTNNGATTIRGNATITGSIVGGNGMNITGPIVATGAITAGPITSSNRIAGRGSIDVVNNTNEGGKVSIINELKTGGAQTKDWAIWNMTGGYGNKLAFWRYMGNADNYANANAGPALEIYDSGEVKVPSGNLSANSIDLQFDSIKEKVPYSGLDYPGNDIRSIPNTTLSNCLTQCSNETNCNNVFMGNDGTCYLKTKTGGVQQKAPGSSYIKKVPNYSIVSTNNPGYDLGGYLDIEHSSCPAKCNENANCVAYTLNTTAGKGCWLKSAINPSNDPGTLTYKKN